jgi:hypothetical protein
MLLLYSIQQNGRVPEAMNKNEGAFDKKFPLQHEQNYNITLGIIKITY